MNEKITPSKKELKKVREKKNVREKLERAKKQLQKAEECWEDDDFIEALKKKTLEEKQKAFDLKLEIGTKLLLIENAQIALVADRVRENSQRLESAIKDLGDALQTLTDVTRILNATGSLLSILSKILVLL